MAKHTVMSYRHLTIVHVDSSPEWGGQQVRILEESKGMIDRGHRVSILCREESTLYKRAREWGVKASVLPLGDKRWANFKTVRAWLKDNAANIDIVNTHSAMDSWLFALAKRSLRDNTTTLLRTRHLPESVANTFANRWLYGKALAHVVTTGESLRHQLLDNLGIPANQVQSVFTGINTRRFGPGDKIAAREQLGLEKDAIWIGMVATLRSGKGHKYLLQAISLLNNPRIRLAIVGDGSKREKLQRRVVEMGLSRQVHFAGNQKDVVPWLQAMDVFALPAYANEGVSQALMQAMAVGLPVVATSGGSSSDVIKTGMTGIVVSPRDANGLTLAIQRLITSPEDAEKMGARARTFALENCSLDRMTTRMEAVYLRAAG